MQKQIVSTEYFGIVFNDIICNIVFSLLEIIMQFLLFKISHKSINEIC